MNWCIFVHVASHIYLTENGTTRDSTQRKRKIQKRKRQHHKMEAIVTHWMRMSHLSLSASRQRDSWVSPRSSRTPELLWLELLTLESRLLKHCFRLATCNSPTSRSYHQVVYHTITSPRRQATLKPILRVTQVKNWRSLCLNQGFKSSTHVWPTSTVRTRTWFYMTAELSHTTRS